MISNKLFVISLIVFGLVINGLNFMTTDADINPPIVNEPYIYHYPPNNSFGIGVTKSLNESFFIDMFRNNFDYMLEYQINGGDWVLGNEYLDIDMTWTNNSFWKINLSFIKPPSPLMNVRFTVGVNIAVLSYGELIGENRYLINYTIPFSGGEVYSCVFDWNDLISIPDLVFTHGVLDSIFWFRFRKDDVPSNSVEKVYVFDPIFGNAGTPPSALRIRNSGAEYIFGCWYEAPADGTVQNMTFRLAYNEGGAGLAVMGIYSYVAVDNAGDLLAETDEFDVGNLDVASYYTYDLLVPLEITNGVKYYFVIACTEDLNDTHDWYLGGETFGNNEIWSDEELGLENPQTGENGEPNEDMGIYASYTEGGGEPPLDSDTPVVFENLTGVVNNSYENSISQTITVDSYDSEGNQTFVYMNCSDGSTDIITSNGTLSIDLNGSYYLQYFISLEGYDDVNYTYENYTFWTVNYTAEEDDNPPVIDSYSIINNSYDNILFTNVTVNVSDPNGDLMNLSIECNNSDVVLHSNVLNGSYLLNFTSSLLNDTSYTLWFNLSDGRNSTNVTIVFYTQNTTAEGGCDCSLFYTKTQIDNMIYTKTESDNMFIGADITLGAVTVGILLFFALVFLAENKRDTVYYFLCAFLGLPMGVYYIAYENTVFGTFLGISILLVCIYFSFLGVAYALGYGRKE